VLGEDAGDLAAEVRQLVLLVGRPRLLRRTVAEAVVRLALAADDVHDRLLALIAEGVRQLLGRTDHVVRVGPGHPAVGGDHEDPGSAGLRAVGLEERMRDLVRVGRHRADRARERISVRRRRLDPGVGLGDARSRDHLLGLEDLLHPLGGADLLLVYPLLGSHVSPRAGWMRPRVRRRPSRGGGSSHQPRTICSCAIASAAMRPLSSVRASLCARPAMKSFFTWESTVSSCSSVADSNLPVVRMVSRMSPLWRRCSSSCASKGRTSSTSRSSNLPVVPAQIETTCSSIGKGEYWDCLSSSIRRAPRLSCCLEAASRSEANIAKASRSRNCASESFRVPETPFMAFVCAEPPTRETETPTSTAGRWFELNRSDCRKHWPSVMEMTLVGMYAETSFAFVSMIGRPVIEPPPISSLSFAQRSRRRECR